MKPIRMWRQRIRVGQNVFNGYCFSNTARTFTCLPSGFVPFALAVMTLPSFEIDTALSGMQPGCEFLVLRRGQPGFESRQHTPSVIPPEGVYVQPQPRKCN
jgi:hypothetical protein